MSDRFITVDPDVMSGTPCLRGTRIPLQTLLDYLDKGPSLDQFLADFPTATRELALGAIAEYYRMPL
jgi:uncharacterized protein (DUF433 family)